LNSRIALGAAQFGHEYGIANKAGRVKPTEVKDILQLAAAHGLNTLDTAIAYGDSEKTTTAALLGKFASVLTNYNT